MKPIGMALLCVILLIQGIGQSYAAHTMQNKPASTAMSLPCHSVQADATMADCCDEHCQCHGVVSAMFVNTMLLSNKLNNSAIQFFIPPFAPAVTQRHYRPPVSA